MTFFVCINLLLRFLNGFNTYVLFYKPESDSEAVSRDSPKSDSDTEDRDSSKPEPHNEGGNDPKPEPDNKDEIIKELKHRLEWHRRVINAYNIEIDAAYDRISVDAFYYFLDHGNGKDLWFYLDLERHELLTEWVEDLLEHIKITMAMIEKK